ncbi:MAG: hypothetical protein HQ543_00510 [Bacteroidetes bacterium]|nr:hypothetical protein [Bacteroidota bacterium]
MIQTKQRTTRQEIEEKMNYWFLDEENRKITKPQYEYMLSTARGYESEWKRKFVLGARRYYQIHGYLTQNQIEELKIILQIENHKKNKELNSK